MIFQSAFAYIEDWDLSAKTKTILNRSLLIIIIAGLVFTQLFYKQKIFIFSQLPKWNSTITLPFHTIKVSYFLIIGLAVSSTLLIPMVLNQEMSDIKSMVLFGILFAIINATLEEIIWRGILLSSIRKYVSTFYAIMITSLGFGLLHISIGIPLLISLLFSFGGLFYAIVVLKTNSIYPAIIFHIVINLGMVFNGWII
ncbi:CPBP family intramembrane glutamic endopeptidase [Neobacillus vireti]|uniref:CPBP family intramembrane glutamic endopeptidase n=1 Tax=Neobacillus vireti TaxID=220686 RepID=UPI002FFDF252